MFIYLLYSIFFGVKGVKVVKGVKDVTFFRLHASIVPIPLLLVVLNAVVIQNSFAVRVKEFT